MSHRALLLTLFVLALALTPLTAAASAQSNNLCSSPRVAVQTWIDHLQQDNFRPNESIRCFDFRAGPSDKGDQETVARNLLAVLDGQGKFVVYNRIPLKSDYVDPASKLPRYVLFPGTLPELYVERSGQRWLISAETVASTDSLFRSTFNIPLERWARSLPLSLQHEVLGVATWKLIGLVLIVLLSSLLGKLLEFLFIGGARSLIQRLLGSWDGAFERQLLRRVNLLFTAIIATWLVPNLALPVRFNQALLLAAKLVLSIASVLIVTALIDLAFNSWQRLADNTDTKMDDQLIPLLRRAAKTIAYIVGFLFVLQNMDIDVGSLLAGLGIGGLAFALAAKDTLANLFGSLTIFTDRPFQIGDYVSVAGVEGSVEEVGFRSTRVRTATDSVVTIPNNSIANSTIDNLGKRRCRRYKTNLGLSYDASPEQIEAFVEGLRASILASPYTQKHRFNVGLHSFGASELLIFVNLYFDTADFAEELEGRHHLHLEWLRLADRIGVSFAFPTQTIHVDTLGPQGRAPLPAQPESFASVVRSFGPGGELSTPKTPEFTEEFWPEDAT